MDKKELVEQLLPLLNQILTIVGTAVVVWIGASVRKWANATDKQATVVADQAEREALNSALRTGAKAAASTTANPTIKDMVAGGLAYAKKVEPKALAAFEADTSALGEKAHARALEAKRETEQQPKC